MDKFVICMPFGGLNDSLCQVYHCLRYCEKTNRTLVITSNYKICPIILSSLIDLCHKSVKIVFNDLHPMTFSDSLTIYPHCIDTNFINNINSALFFYDSDKHRHCFLDFKNVISSFDVNAKYDEDVLVYAQSGGGDFAQHLCDYMKIKDVCVKHFRSRYDKIKKPYVSIHIRNTDINCDIEKFSLFLKSQNINNRNIFLATDDLYTRNYISNLFNNKIFYFSNLGNDVIDNVSKRKGLHYNYKISKQERNLDAVSDLLCLALSDRIYHPYEFYNKNNDIVSPGYTNLAVYLNNNKTVVENMLR